MRKLNENEIPGVEEALDYPMDYQRTVVLRQGLNETFDMITTDGRGIQATTESYDTLAVPSSEGARITLPFSIIEDSGEVRPFTEDLSRWGREALCYSVSWANSRST